MEFTVDQSKRYGFMPGCSLPSYNPEAVIKTTEYLNDTFDIFFKNYTNVAVRSKNEIIKIMFRNNISKEIIEIMQPFLDNPCLETFTPIQDKYNIQKDLW